MQLIVLNDTGFVAGGAAQVAIASLNSLADAGCSVTFVSNVAPIDDRIDIRKVRVVNFGFYELINNPSRIDAAIKGIWNVRCSEKLNKLLGEYDRRETLVHLHSWTKSFSSSIVHQVTKMGFKLVCTLHDYFSICPNGGLYNYVTQKHCNIPPMSLSCALTNCDSRSYPQKIWRVGRHLVQEKAGGMPFGVNYFITVSGYSEALMRPYLPSQAKIFRIRNPIDIVQMSYPTLEKNSIFSFIGRLSPEKGASIFATAAKKTGVNTVFVGSGPEMEAVRNINPAAKFLGWKDKDSVVANIRASRAIVFPSMWHETQGLVVMEAAALGVPAIVSDGCAAKEMIIDGETGLLFRRGDIEDLAQKLALLNHEPNIAAHLGRVAYDRYWENPCSLENHVKELIECYKEILS